MPASLSPSGTILYADCFSGISGDMFLAALIDAGLPEPHLRASLASVGLGDYELEIAPCRRNGITGTKIIVSATGRQAPRSWRAIQALLRESGLGQKVKDTALAIFRCLAEAEAKVHDVAVDEVHFHETGAVDSIVDIAGAAIGLDYFGVNGLFFSPLPMPRGWIRCAHGLLPLPAPAVCELAKGIPVYGVEAEHEMVTPTGAAIVKALGTDFGPMPAMLPQRTGYGAGARRETGGRPNLLRLVTGRRLDGSPEAREVVVIETNLDDHQPESLPYVASRLFKAGALDVVFIPATMKKGRAGVILQVMGTMASQTALQEIILTETSALGVRFRREQRLTLPRRTENAITAGGPVRLKVAQTPAGERRTPEYEDCVRAAQKSGLPIAEIYRQALGDTATRGG